MSRRRWSRSPAIARGEHRPNVADRTATRSDVEERSRHDAYHAVQEARATNLQPDDVAVALDVDRMQRSHGTSALR